MSRAQSVRFAPKAFDTEPAPDLQAERAAKNSAQRSAHAIADLIPSDRPRERLHAQGAAALPTADLLAILVNTGRRGHSAIDAGAHLHRALHDRLTDLPGLSLPELREISIAVGPAAFARIQAGVELGRRVAEAEAEGDAAAAELSTTEQARVWCARRFARLAAEARHEEFHIVTCDLRHRVIQTHFVTRGLLDTSLVDVRSTFRPAIRDAASGIVCVHNHPSGDPGPSQADWDVTDQLIRAGRLLGVGVLDHIVVGRTAISMRQHGGGLDW